MSTQTCKRIRSTCTLMFSHGISSSSIQRSSIPGYGASKILKVLFYSDVHPALQTHQANLHLNVFTWNLVKLNSTQFYTWVRRIKNHESSDLLRSPLGPGERDVFFPTWRAFADTPSKAFLRASSGTL